jgi:hypothetical protein
MLVSRLGLCLCVVMMRMLETWTNALHFCRCQWYRLSPFRPSSDDNAIRVRIVRDGTRGWVHVRLGPCATSC